jgi:type II secretory pathway component PulJ
VPSDAELDRVMTVMEKMWRRLVEMVQRVQKELSSPI